MMLFLNLAMYLAGKQAAMMIPQFAKLTHYFTEAYDLLFFSLHFPLGSMTAIEQLNLISSEVAGGLLYHKDHVCETCLEILIHYAEEHGGNTAVGILELLDDIEFLSTELPQLSHNERELLASLLCTIILHEKNQPRMEDPTFIATLKFLVEKSFEKLPGDEAHGTLIPRDKFFTTTEFIQMDKAPRYVASLIYDLTERTRRNFDVEKLAIPDIIDPLLKVARDPTGDSKASFLAIMALQNLSKLNTEAAVALRGLKEELEQRLDVVRERLSGMSSHSAAWTEKFSQLATTAGIGILWGALRGTRFRPWRNYQFALKSGLKAATGALIIAEAIPWVSQYMPFELGHQAEMNVQLLTFLTILRVFPFSLMPLLVLGLQKYVFIQDERAFQEEASEDFKEPLQDIYSRSQRITTLMGKFNDLQKQEQRWSSTRQATKYEQQILLAQMQQLVSTLQASEGQADTHRDVLSVIESCQDIVGKPPALPLPPQSPSSAPPARRLPPSSPEALVKASEHLPTATASSATQTALEGERMFLDQLQGVTMAIERRTNPTLMNDPVIHDKFQEIQHTLQLLNQAHDYQVRSLRMGEPDMLIEAPPQLGQRGFPQHPSRVELKVEPPTTK